MPGVLSVEISAGIQRRAARFVNRRGDTARPVHVEQERKHPRRPGSLQICHELRQLVAFVARVNKPLIRIDRQAPMICPMLIEKSIEPLHGTTRFGK